jgi:YD repeat-containing protein
MSSYGYYHTSDISLYPSKRFAYDANGNILYRGHAHAGAKEDDPVWTIEKYIYDVNGNVIGILLAEGKVKYDLKWTERDNYNYF